MKKMLIAAISAIAVIASVIGCQVYDSQKNTVLASWMDKNGSDIRIYEDFAAEFNDACVKFRDASSDNDAYNIIVDAYLGFDKFYAGALTAVQTIVMDEKDAAIADVSADAAAEGKTAEEIKVLVAKKEIELTEKYNPLLHDKDWVVTQYKEKYSTKDFVWSNIISKIGAKQKDWTKVSVEACVGKEFTLAGLYEDVYKLRWDYNSKK